MRAKERSGEVAEPVAHSARLVLRLALPFNRKI